MWPKASRAATARGAVVLRGDVGAVGDGGTALRAYQPGRLLSRVRVPVDDQDARAFTRVGEGRGPAVSRGDALSLSASDHHGGLVVADGLLDSMVHAPGATVQDARAAEEDSTVVAAIRAILSTAEATGQDPDVPPGPA